MQHLNLHHLRYFWLVASCGNLTQAASRLNISQSSLSIQIRQLEDSLGTALFDRANRRLQLTPFGAMVLHYAQEIFELSEELVRAVEGEASRSRLRFRIGSVSTLSRNFQEQFLQPLMTEPALHLVIESGGMEELLSRLQSFQLDLVLSNRPIGSQGESDWRCQQLARQQVSLVGRPDPGFARLRFPKDLAQLRLLLPGRNSDIRTQLDALFDRWEIEPNIIAEVDDMPMLRLLARDGLGVAAVPRVVVKDELKEQKLVVLHDFREIFENFYAISVKRLRKNATWTRLLRKAVQKQSLPIGPHPTSRVL